MSLITLILLTLDTSGLSLQEQGKPLKTETKDYYETWQAGAPIDMPAMASNSPATPFYPPNAYADIKDEIQAVFEADSDMALKIVKCESGFKTDVISKTNDVGIFQVNLATHWDTIPGQTRAEKILWLQNPINNIQFAYMLFTKRGNFNDWVCYTKGLI